jgi:hypothetical protein
MKNPFHTEMIATFCNWYSKAKGIRYNFLSIDARKIDELYAVLRAHWDEKRPDKPPSCLEFQEYFLHFLDYIPRLHKWLFANLDLKNIASKAQIIIALIEDNRRGATSGGQDARTPYAPKDLQTRLELLNAMTND